MIREMIKESKQSDIMKYFPKKLQKEVKNEIAQTKMWIEAMNYPRDTGYFGFYGAKDGDKLEFNVKTHLEYDEDKLKEIFGDEELYSQLNFYEEEYYNMGREDLEEGLKSEFGLGDFSYAGRSGGYLLIGDYEDFLFNGTDAYDIHVEEEYIDEQQDYLDEIEVLINDLADEGPMGDYWDSYISDLEDLIENGFPYDNSIKKGAEKIISKNYKKLEKFIEDSTKNFGNGFEDFVISAYEANNS